jgi:hypothetical protein
MENVKLTLVLVGMIFMSASFIGPMFADENYCLSQEGSGSQGYCEEQLIEEGNGVTINWCVGADMNAPNPTGKTECIGNAMEPY